MKGRILVVDADPEVVAGFGLFFSEKGYEVRGAANAHQAMQLVEKEKFGLIFLDNDLPGTTGLQALPGLARKSGAPVMMITALYDPDLKKDALLLGALDLVALPADFPDLEKTVSRIVGQ
ncbi:MAG: response regulator [Elusimicrobia bacterium]|nr:response regulator [Elusimicrobiota bacterium]